MEYDIKPIVTEYAGIVFRSRTEAYAYQYFRYTNVGSIILYESKYYSDRNYTPDFIIGDYEKHIAIEVKPQLEIGDRSKYDYWLNTFSCMDDFILWTPEGFRSFIYKNDCTYPIDEVIWKRSFNEVQYFINRSHE